MSNLSLLALPAFYFLGLYPHIYAQRLLTSTDFKAYDNANPRSSSNTTTVSKTLGPQYHRYERAKAAHQNANENFPLFAAAILAGTIVGMPANELNFGVALVIGSRVAYNYFYISTEKGPWSMARSASWAVGMFTCVGMLIRAGLRTM